MNEYKQQIIDFYDKRNNYDNDFTQNRALMLCELIPLKLGQTVLDVATGTGFIAIESAKKVGNQGKVIGIDFSPLMLQRCQDKINAADLTNIELRQTDVDNLDFPENSFDVIFCSSAIVLFTDVIQILQNWYNWLKPSGFVAFSVYSQESFFTPVILKVCNQLGYDLPNIHNLLGTEEKCQNILKHIGYNKIDIKKNEWGKYLDEGEAQDWWQGNWLHPVYHPLLKLNSQEREELKSFFRLEISNLKTPQGVWDENTMFLITAQK